MLYVRGIFAMPSVDPTSTRPVDAMKRKRWETPSVILGSARRNTQSNLNTVGVDGVSALGSSYGS